MKQLITVPRVTLKKLAQAAGVSVSAASQAVNRTGTLSKRTREHILNVAEEIGYQRNALLSSIASKQSRGLTKDVHNPVGVISIGRSDSKLSEYHADLLTHFQKVAPKYGFNLQALGALDSLEGINSHLKRLYQAGVQGLLVLNSSDGGFLKNSDLIDRFSVLGVGDIYGEFLFDVVKPDWGARVVRCYNYLQAEGCSKIALLQHYPDLSNSIDVSLRLASYLGECYKGKQEPIVWETQWDKALDLSRSVAVVRQI